MAPETLIAVLQKTFLHPQIYRPAKKMYFNFISGVIYFDASRVHRRVGSPQQLTEGFP
jgi:hypothetical protein